MKGKVEGGIEGNDGRLSLVKKIKLSSSSKHIRQLGDAHAHDRPREDERARDELGCAVDLKRRGRLEVVLRARDGRVVVPDEEGLAGLGEEAGGEEEADAEEVERGEGEVSGRREERREGERRTRGRRRP